MGIVLTTLQLLFGALIDLAMPLLKSSNNHHEIIIELSLDDIAKEMNWDSDVISQLLQMTIKNK